jgi:hypothetical protein
MREKIANTLAVILLLAVLLLAFVFVARADVVTCGTGTTSATAPGQTTNTRTCPGAVPGRRYTLELRRNFFGSCGAGYYAEISANTFTLEFATASGGGFVTKFFQGVVLSSGVVEFADASGCASGSVDVSVSTSRGTYTPVFIKTGGF